jgi:3-oxosteroid 1-dehydrogenase
MSAPGVLDDSTMLPAEVDVIVVGSGAAALTGAYTAAANGLSVLVLEKTKYLGGTCAYAGAALWLPGNHVLAREGVDDSVEAGVTYIHATVGDRTPQELQETYVRTSAELVAFLDETRAVELEHMPFPDYFEAPGRAKPSGRAIAPKPIAGSTLGAALDLLRPTGGADKFDRDVPRETLTGGQSLIGQLMLALDQTGNADVRIECPMESLVIDDGAVVGVVAGGQQVKAGRGVLVAAGGYDADPVRRHELHDLPTANWSATPVGANTGDALEVLQAAGADVDLLDEAWWAPAVLFPNGRASFLCIVQGGIFVGPDGKRFANESLPYDQMGHELRKQMQEKGADTEFWWLFDSRVEGAPGICEPPLLDLAEFRGTSYLRNAETVEELATLIGVPAGALHDTVDQFNKAAADGTDTEYGRGVDDYDRFFGVGEGPNPVLVPMDQPDFRALRIVLSDLGTKGGARTDESGRVLDTSGSPVRNLYAAGNSAASVAGHVYPGPGTPLGSGMVFGYRAAMAMVGEGPGRDTSRTTGDQQRD